MSGESASKSLSAAQVRNRVLEEALALAANRLDRAAIDYIAEGRPLGSHIAEWADEARATLHGRTAK